MNDIMIQDRFKRFLRIENIDEIKNKSFYLELLRVILKNT